MKSKLGIWWEAVKADYKAFVNSATGQADIAAFKTEALQLLADAYKGVILPELTALAELLLATL